jgi:hypothetical protein
MGGGGDGGSDGLSAREMDRACRQDKQPSAQVGNAPA